MASWTIIDAETDEEVGTVTGDSGFFEYDGDEFEVSDIVGGLYSSDEDSFADDFNRASGGRYVAVSDGGDDYSDDSWDEAEKAAEADGDSPEDDPDLSESEFGWVATISEVGGKRLGQVAGNLAGRVEFDISNAAFQGRMLLDVVPALEAVAMTPARPEYQDAFKRTVESLDGGGKFRVDFREVLNIREAMEGLGYRGAGDAPNAVVRWGSSSPDWGGPAAPWSPVPLEPARKFIKDNPDAAIEVNFPTVFEEDRSAKIGDLIKGDLAGFISHRNAAEQYAKEMGFEQYDYDDTQEEIAQEHPRDSVAPDMKPTAGKGGGGEPGGGGSGVVKASPLQQPQAERPGAGVTRAVWAGDDAAGRHAFRAEQKRLSEIDDEDEEE
jgi:hypothetical protein